MYNIYSEHILNHGLNPRNQGVLNPADAEYEGDNPLCGDHLHLTLQFDENKRIAAVAWEGENCTISQASASMLGERIIGKTLEEVRQINTQDVFTMLDIPLSTNRATCALLSFKVLTVALFGPDEWRKHELEDEERS